MFYILIPGSSVETKYNLPGNSPDVNSSIDGS